MILVNSCDQDISEWQPLVQDIGNKQALVKTVNYRSFPGKWSFTKSYTQHFFYRNDRLEEIQQVGNWIKQYHYKDDLLISRITLGWKDGDTLQIDSFTYHELPLRLKQKKELQRGSTGKFLEQYYTYAYSPQGNIVKIIRLNTYYQPYLISNIEWDLGNPSHIITNDFDYISGTSSLILDEKYIYEDGLNYEFYQHWNPDELRAKNNFKSYSKSSPVADLGSFGYNQRIEYDAQGYPERIYKIHCASCNWVDTIDITYQ